MKGLQKLFIILPGLLIAASAGSCNLDVTDSGKGRIVLGDSATIVTEHDAQYLEDAFTDLEDTALEEQLRPDEDSFNNVAKAQQLAQQQQQDSIAKVKAAEEQKKKDADAAKKKEAQRKQDEKDRKKNKKQTASQKKKAEEEKKKKRR
ncbi:MAG: hypothetical protein JNM21_15330 [Taibaiella sp.]|nr:hypothetical protein [Taibaiella sp.]